MSINIHSCCKTFRFDFLLASKVMQSDPRLRVGSLPKVLRNGTLDSEVHKPLRENKQKSRDYEALWRRFTE